MRAEHAAAAVPALLQWTEAGVAMTARWQSEAGLPPPKRIQPADDTLTADTAYRLACEGTAFVWRGDFQNARQLLQALTRRAERKPRNPPVPSTVPGAAFRANRHAQAQRARILGMLLIPVDADYGIPLRRAPDARTALEEALGRGTGAMVMSLRELQGLIGAHEWRKKGVEVPALKGRIHPHYGVFAPIRSEYVGLLARAPLTTTTLAWDIGTGTGVLAAVLARRGVLRVVATETDPRALACARDNIARLGVADRVTVVEADLFPGGRAPLIVCNPPWVPANPSSALERAIFDPDCRMLKGFLFGLAAHLEPKGEGWLLLSDFAEQLGLRTRADLMGWIDAAGLVVVGRLDVRPDHPKTRENADPLHAARAAEMTTLWRLAAKPPTPA